MTTETAKLLEQVDTNLGEIGETIQDALDSAFQEEYDVVNVSIEKEGLIVVSINLLEEPEED